MRLKAYLSVFALVGLTVAGTASALAQTNRFDLDAAAKLSAQAQTSIAQHPEVAGKIKLLEAWIETQMEYRGQPGISVGVVYDQKLIWARGFGYADVEKKIAATTATIYRMASVTAGCQAVYQHPRNKSDAALRALARKGGVFGIYQINPYLGPKERNTLDDFLRHLEHAINVCGLDHVAIGSDREHRTIPDTLAEKQKLIDELSRLRPVTAATFRWPFFIAELNHPRRMETIAAALTKRGHKAAAIDKLLGGNWYRLLRDVLG